MVALPPAISPTVSAIDRYHEQQEAKAKPRGYIGGSSIGHPCERALWYRFRFAHTPEQFEGRMLRLFQTGHREEDRMISDLRNAGVEVFEIDPDTKQQWAVSECDGHFRGHADGVLVGVIEAPKTPHLFEAKTHNQKSFDQLVKHGVATAKPEHMAQMQVYMHLLGLTRAFYLAKNKNTDEYYAERVEYDATHAAALIAKAQRIKDANAPPARVSDNPDYFLCKAFKCPAYDICHLGEMPNRNCRTCLHSTPISGGEWHCARHEKTLALDDQLTGCPNHLYLPSLVAGEQIDADETNETVTYRMPDGRAWVDGHERTSQ